MALHRGTSAATKTPRARLDNMEKAVVCIYQSMPWHACSQPALMDATRYQGKLAVLEPKAWASRAPNELFLDGNVLCDASS